MSVQNRNFSNFELGDNVYELADGVIPELAQYLNVELGSEPNTEALGEIVGKLGKYKVLRENEEIHEISNDVMADLLDRSGVQQGLDRSLWTPSITSETTKVDVAVLSGGVANWQDRSATAIPHHFTGAVYLPTGNRLMNSPTEVVNPNVHHIEKSFGRLPNEAEYAASIIVPTLVSRGRLNVLMTSYATSNGADIARQFIQENPALLEEKILFVRVANAGIQLAIEMRKAAREIRSSFDDDLNNPQVFIATDSFPIARTAEQLDDAAHYQKPQTGLAQVAKTAKFLYEATL